MPSLIPDITETLPALLSAREVSAEGSAKGVLYDLVVSGIGFVFAIDSSNPYVRESAQVQKQQIDTSPEAGEQPLESGWTRSQTSWHHGAGADFYEPADRTSESQYRFKDSRGVDVWTRGQLSLLRRMDAVDESALSSAVCGARLPSGLDVWYSLVGPTLYRHEGATTVTQATLPAVAGGRLANAGSVLLLGATDGIYKADLTGSSIVSLATASTGTMVAPYWVKGRVIASRGNVLHQTTLAGGALDTSSVLFTHPDDSWTWTGVSETPDAVLAAGHSGGISAVYAFTLEDDSGGLVPKLSQPRTVLELPPGEEIRSIRSYLGTYVGIGTSAGVRVAVAGDSGRLQMGPVLVQTDDPVLALAARDSYLYAATGSSVIRVDLSESVDEGLRFPYAYDVEVDSASPITSLAFDGVTDRVVAAADGVGTFAASTTEYVPTGWLLSGGIRYGTTASKTFRSLDVAGRTDGATSIAVSAVVDNAQLNLVTLSQGKSGLGIGLGGLPPLLGQASYRLELHGTTSSPTVDAVAVRAIPRPPAQRLVQFPVLCADEMRDAKRVPFGRSGYGTTLLAALEGLENSGAIVSVHDLTRPEKFAATIEKVEFARVRPRGASGAPNFGGIAKITVRTV